MISIVSHDEVSVRRAAAYALGALAEMNFQVFRPVLEESWVALSRLASSEDGREGENTLVTQNALSAMGKILHFHGDFVDVNSLLPAWISLLPPPISEEEENCEVIVIYTQLCHFATSTPTPVTNHLPLMLITLINALQDPYLLDEATKTELAEKIKNARTHSSQLAEALQSLPLHLLPQLSFEPN